MKKFLALLLAVLMVLCLFGCAKKGGGEQGGEPASSDDHYDVVFLADLGSIYDGGFNEHSFYGIRDYCEENGLKYTYLQPAGSDDASRITIFEQAINQMTADVLVAVGYLWDAALCQEIPNYPDTKVIFVDAPEEVRLKRATERDSAKEKQIKARMKMQQPDIQRGQADFVIQNFKADDTKLLVQLKHIIHKISCLKQS